MNTNTTAPTAAQVLASATRIGMQRNGWTFDQAYRAAVAAMIATDPQAMRELAAQFA